MADPGAFDIITDPYIHGVLVGVIPAPAASYSGGSAVGSRRGSGGAGGGWNNVDPQREL